MLAQRLAHCAPDTARSRERAQGLAARLLRAESRLVEVRGARVAAAAAQLRAFDPNNTLARGYAIVRDAGGAIVRDAAQLAVGQRVGLSFARGEAYADVAAVNKTEE